MSTPCFYSTGLLTLVFERAAGFHAPGRVRPSESTENLLDGKKQKKKAAPNSCASCSRCSLGKIIQGFCYLWCDDWNFIFAMRLIPCTLTWGLPSWNDRVEYSASHLKRLRNDAPKIYSRLITTTLQFPLGNVIRKYSSLFDPFLARFGVFRVFSAIAQ